MIVNTPMSVSDALGLSQKDTVAALDKLFKLREEIEKKMESFGKVSLSGGIPLEYVELQQQHAAVDERINRAMNWYSVHLLESSHKVLESLEVETRTLKWLTVVLIGLTVVLAVFTGLLLAGVRL